MNNLYTFDRIISQAEKFERATNIVSYDPDKFVAIKLDSLDTRTLWKIRGKYEARKLSKPSEERTEYFVLEETKTPTGLCMTATSSLVATARSSTKLSFPTIPGGKEWNTSLYTCYLSNVKGISFKNRHELQHNQGNEVVTDRIKIDNDMFCYVYSQGEDKKKVITPIGYATEPDIAAKLIAFINSTYNQRISPVQLLSTELRTSSETYQTVPLAKILMGVR